MKCLNTACVLSSKTAALLSRCHDSFILSTALIAYLECSTIQSARFPLWILANPESFKSNAVNGFMVLLCHVFCFFLYNTVYYTQFISCMKLTNQRLFQQLNTTPAPVAEDRPLQPQYYSTQNPEPVTVREHMQS